jgi:hypothetical protein
VELPSRTASTKAFSSTTKGFGPEGELRLQCVCDRKLLLSMLSWQAPNSGGDTIGETARQTTSPPAIALLTSADISGDIMMDLPPSIFCLLWNAVDGERHMVRAGQNNCR